MTRKSRNDDALARMRAANPFSATELREAIADAELARAMQRAIAAGESPSQPIPAGDRVAREHAVRTRSARSGVFSRHRGASLSLGGLACVAVIAALILLSGGSVDSVRDGAHPTFAAAAVEVAEANPRLLVTAPGWSIVHARSFEVDSGELIYGDGEHPPYGPGGRQLDLNWYPARFYRDRLREDGHASSCHGHAGRLTSTLLGQRATTFAYAGQHPNYTTILSPQGNVFIEISGSFGSKQEYEAVLHSLRPVGVDAWLAAMPAEVVRPAARSAAIAQMLRGIPVPPGFDPPPCISDVLPGPRCSALQSESALTDRFMLGEVGDGSGRLRLAPALAVRDPSRRWRRGAGSGRGDGHGSPLAGPPADGPGKGLSGECLAAPRSGLAVGDPHRGTRNRRRPPQAQAGSHHDLREGAPRRVHDPGRGGPGERHGVP